MRHASAPSASALLAILAATVAGCGTREPTPATQRSQQATDEASGAVSSATTDDPSAGRLVPSDDAGWPNRSSSVIATIDSSEGVRPIGLRAEAVGPPQDVGIGPSAAAPASLVRFRPDAEASTFVPQLRVLDRIEWSGERATRHLTVEGWLPGVEVFVRIPRELLGRETRLLVNGAPLEADPGATSFDLHLSRDETTVVEWSRLDSQVPTR